MGDRRLRLRNLIMNTFGYAFWKNQNFKHCPRRREDDLSEAAGRGPVRSAPSPRFGAPASRLGRRVAPRPWPRALLFLARLSASDLIIRHPNRLSTFICCQRRAL